MSRLVLVRSLVLVLLSLVVLGGCGGSGGEDSEHDLVPAPETNVTDTNTTPDTNGTQPDDSNGTTGGGSDDGNATGGGDDTNTTDVTPPVITLNGEANMTLEQNATYTEPGAVAVDAVDGNVPVSISGNVDTSTVGHYVVTYSATDHAGNQAHATRHIKIINSAPTLTSLGLESNTTTLNKDHNTTLTLTATYSDHTTKPLTSGITWIITPSDAVTLHGTTLTAIKDVNVTVQAKVGTILSNKVNLNIYWEVNGHRLPPEPDPAVNDATLGGVDSNNNGVRDDVERKIYEKYPVKLHQRVLIDDARFYQQVMVQDVSKAKEIVKFSIKEENCELYLMNIDDTIYSDDWRKNGLYIKEISINTKERVRKYLDYNIALSGGVYGSSPADWNRDACSQEVRKVLEEMGK